MFMAADGNSCIIGVADTIKEVPTPSPGQEMVSSMDATGTTGTATLCQAGGY